MSFKQCANTRNWFTIINMTNDIANTPKQYHHETLETGHYQCRSDFILLSPLRSSRREASTSIPESTKASKFSSRPQIAPIVPHHIPAGILGIIASPKSTPPKENLTHAKKSTTLKPSPKRRRSSEAEGDDRRPAKRQPRRRSFASFLHRLGPDTR